MKTSVLKLNFSKALSSLYPSEEIQSFFSILSEKYLGLTRLELALQVDKDISEVNVNNFETAILRLKKYEPIQYILGETEFYGLLFFVNEHTLIPRPETEELVDWVLKETKTQDTRPRSLLDIGTGSGCIAVSLAKNLPNCKVSAVDISEGALKVAVQNAFANRVKVYFEKLDILVSKRLSESYDIIISNPPYVRELEKKLMHANVLTHEPNSALFVSDENPLVFYRKIVRLAKKYLNNGGLLYFEINEYLSEGLVAMLKEEGLKGIEIKKDVFGKDRMIKCVKNE